MQENWLPAPGLRNYEVSDHGRVRNIRTGLVRSPRLVHGYPTFTVKQDGRSCHARVHVLVAAAFIGPRPDGLEVCHGDGNRQNNAASNLRYGTRRENVLDMARHGTKPIGERHGRAKLRQEDVVEIRSSTGAAKDLAERLGVGVQTVSRIRRGASWKGAFFSACEVGQDAVRASAQESAEVRG